MNLEYITISNGEMDAYEEIRGLINRANQVNEGFRLKTADYSAQELIDRVGKCGKTFVAYAEGKVVGTLSVRFADRQKWYYSGEMPEYVLAAVSPNYQSQGVLSALTKMAFRFVKDQGYSAIKLDTAINNARAIAIYKHMGFHPIDFTTYRGADHYSVIMVKWFDECPFSKLKIAIRYYAKKVYIQSRFKPGWIKRFI